MEIKVYHFSGVQAGGTVNSVEDKTSSGGKKGGTGGGAFCPLENKGQKGPSWKI